MGGELPSVERKWLEYYDSEELNVAMSGSSMFDSIHHTDYTGREAFSFFGTSFTYGRFYDEIDKAAKAFVASGVKKGDIVMLMLPTLPETLYCFYALNRIGAVSNLVDVRYTTTQLKQVVQKVRPRMLVAMTFYLRRLESVRSELGLEKIVLLRGCESLSSFIGFWNKFGDFFNGRLHIANRCADYLFWADFIKTGSACKTLPDVEVNGDDVAAIFQTSGTTGFLKSVVHTNSNLNNSTMMKHFHLNDPKPGDRVLSIIPCFALFGFVFDVHMPLKYGMNLSIVPLFNVKGMASLIVKHRPNHIFSVPSQWEHVLGRIKPDCDLSFIKTVYVAGEVLDKSLRLKVNGILGSGNSKAELCSDYGMTETAGTISFIDPEAARDDACGEGYSGIPMPLCDVCIYDDESERELNYNEEGEICVRLPFSFKEYYNDPEATKELQRIHSDGKVWLHTGDTGYLTDHGHLYVIGRKKRMIVRFDGTKIFPIELEAVIKAIDGVVECSVVAGPDPEHSQAHLPYVFVVPDESSNRAALKREIKRRCSEKLPLYLQPYRVCTVDEIPHNSMGKIDYLNLTEQIKTEC